MFGTMNSLLIACLLPGALFGWKVLMPSTIQVLNGSCVTIPCSFDKPTLYESDLDNTCKALWKKSKMTVFDSSDPQKTTIKGELTGNLTQKDCTTTLTNMQPAYSDNYVFRVECNKTLINSFRSKILISVTADPSRPTLTPSTLKVKEGTSVTLTCSAPAPCLSHPPTLTWTPGLGDSQETLQENQDKTKVMTSVLKFTASHHHHGTTISCTAVYNKQDGSTESAVSTSLTADISYCSGRVSLPFFIITVVALAAALMCALLFAVRAQTTGCRIPTKSRCTGDTSMAVRSQDLTSVARTKEPITTEEDIYTNIIMMKKSNMTNTHLGLEQIAHSSSEKNDDGSDVLYSSVIWKDKKKKTKKKREDCVDMHQPGRAYQEEERCMVGGICRNYVSSTHEMAS